MSLQTFHTEFDEHEVSLTALLVDGEPWFKGVEAAAALGYKNLPQAIRVNVDDEDKTTLDNLRVLRGSTLTNGNEGAAVYISESGLYSLIMTSKLPHAKAFKRWVLKEVLPTIRRTGSYTAQPAAEEVEPATLTDAQQWDTRRARLDAISSSHTLALPPEVARLASEFARALKTACQQTELVEALKNHHEFGGGSNDVRMYHAHVDAFLLDAVYYNFQRRELYQRVCTTHGDAQTHLALRVEEALQNSRGTAAPRERSQRRGPRAA
jgi:prophage antirepressor-like protein